MKFQGFIGPTYKLPSTNVDAQRLLNMYPEMMESGAGKEAQVAFFKACPGLLKQFTTGSGPLRLIHFDGLEKDDGSYFQRNRIFIVSGPEVFRYSYDPTVGWSKLYLGLLNTSTGPVSAASSDQSYGATVFVDGSAENYVYRKTGVSTETFETFTAAGYVPVARASSVDWIDGYFTFIIKNTNDFYVSEWNSLTVTALNFASAEGSPDSIVAQISNHRDLWLFNKNTVEIFANTGNASFPFERVQGGFIENGCLAGGTVKKLGDVIFWLGRDRSGQGLVQMANGTTHHRISTHAIENMIASYANLEDATAYTYQDKGHSFYVLNFAEATLVYDLSTKMWHERGYLNAGVEERHRVEFCCFFPNLAIHLVGDRSNSNVYKFDDNTFTDDLNPIKRLRAFPHVSGGKKFIAHNSLELDIETGVGLDGASTLQGHDPQVMMRYSDDGGKTFSSYMQASIGKIGRYKDRVAFRRLGTARDRVYEVSMTDPVKAVWLSAELDVTQGVS